MNAIAQINQIFSDALDRQELAGIQLRKIMERKLQEEIASQGRADDEMLKLLADHVTTLKISGDKFSADIEKSKPATNAEIIAELLHALYSIMPFMPSIQACEGVAAKRHANVRAADIARSAIERAEGRAA